MGSYSQGNLAVNSTQINASVYFNIVKESNKELLKSLQPCDINSIQREKKMDLAPGTCEWIMDVPQFKEWRKKNIQILWMFGKLGSGKSFLVCHICEQLRKTKKPVMQFFFDSKTPTKENSLSSLKKFYQTCLYQLLVQVPKDTKARCFEIASEKLGDGDPTPESSLEAISEILKVLGEAYLVVDALDECVKVTEIAQVKWLQELRALRQLKIIVTSRPLETMKSMARDTLQFHLSTVVDKSNKDIQLYIQHRINIKGLPLPSNSQMWKEKLQEQSDGMILYVRLMLDICKDRFGDEGQLLRDLDKSPRGLSKLYARRLESLLKEDETTEFVHTVFQWLAVCRDPPRLADLCSVVSVQRQIRAGSYEWSAAQEIPEIDEDYIRKCLSHFCLPLVEIVKDEHNVEIVRFVHTSVCQFLEGQQIEPEASDGRCPAPFCVDVTSSHKFAAMICLTYLRWDSAAPAADRPAFLQNQNLQRYAAMEWEDHCEMSQKTLMQSEKEKEVVLSFFQDQVFYDWLDLRVRWDKPFRFLFGLQDAARPRLIPSPLHIAIHYGLWETAPFLVQGNVHRVDAAGNRPLHIAAARGSAEFFKMLVDNGAVLDAADRNGLHPLHRAVRHRNTPVVKMFVQDWPDVVAAANGCNPTPLEIACQLGREDCTLLLLRHARGIGDAAIPKRAFHLAVENGHYRIVQRFLKADRMPVENCGEPLLQAARKGKLDTVKLLITNSDNLFYRDQHGQTVLHKACISGHRDLVKLLLDQKIPADPVDHALKTPLCFAAEKGFIEIVCCLLDHDANINNRDRKHETPLFRAAENGHTKMVQVLLEHGTDAALRNRWNQSALGFASRKGHLKIVDLLLRQKGVDVNEPDAAGRAVLHVAAASLQAGQEEIIDRLVDHGARADQVTTRTRQTALHTAILRRQGPAATAALAQRLVERGVPLHQLDSFGRSALFCAAWASNLDVVRVLLAAGAAVDSNAFFMAIHRQNTDLLQLFLQARRRPNMARRNWYGWTALHMAVLQNHPDMVARLLREGAPAEALDHQKMTPLMYAENVGNPEILRLLREASKSKPGQASQQDVVGRTSLHVAVLSDSVAAVERLLKAGADTELADEIGQTAAHYAAERQEDTPAVLKLLLRSHAHMEAADKRGRRPLHLAAFQGNLEAVHILLGAARAQQSGDKQGKTPLHLAVVGGHEEVVRALLDKGGPDVVDCGDIHQKTALHVAAQEGRDELVSLLLEHISPGSAAVVDRQDSTGKTALHLAAAKGHLGIVRQLLGAGALAHNIDRRQFMAMHLAAAAGHRAVVGELLDALPGHVERRLDDEALPGTQHGRPVLAAHRLWELQTWRHERYSVPRTMLMCAVRGGHVDVVRLILEKVPKMPLQTEEFGHASPLTLAASRGYADIVRLLIEAGADVNDTPDGQSTALHEAAKGGHADVIRLLLDQGHANPDMALPSDGSVPLHLAAEGGHEKAVQALVRVAFLNALDDANCTPMKRACRSGRETIVNQLLEAGANVQTEDIQLAIQAKFDKDTIEIMQDQSARQSEVKRV